MLVLYSLNCPLPIHNLHSLMDCLFSLSMNKVFLDDVSNEEDDVTISLAARCALLNTRDIPASNIILTMTSGKEIGYGVLAGVGAFAASFAVYKGVQYLCNKWKVRAWLAMR